MIFVVIVGDVRVFRDGVAELLAREDDVHVVATTATDDDIAAQLREANPDVALVDMTSEHALDVVRKIHAASSGTKIVALAVSAEETTVVATATAGASALLAADAPREELAAAVTAAVRGETLCSPTITGILLRRVISLAGVWAQGVDTTLTRRETEIVRLIDQGLSNKQIAHRLSIEVSTVKNHVHNILEKLQVERRSDAAARLRAQTVRHVTFSTAADAAVAGSR
jgi:DNA-binding NarL/FixJ family response regulator